MKSIMISKNKILIGLITIVIISIIGVTFYTNQTQEEPDPYANLPVPNATWVTHAETPRELIEKADIVGVGTVIDSYTLLVGDIVTTRNIVEFDQVYTMSLDTANINHINSSKKSVLSGSPFRVEVSQTGGIHGEYATRPFKEAPLLEVGETYFLSLEKLYPDTDYYLVLGGFQGRADIVNGKIHFTTESQPFDFSDLNVSLSDFTNKLQKFELDPTEYIVNTENKPVEMFMSDLRKIDNEGISASDTSNSGMATE